MTMREIEEGERWLLPDGVEEILPPAARRIESLRRRLLDVLHLSGYELVMPPMLEYLESLLVGVGSDLDLQTLKVTDQLTGRMMGLRADITSQAARIDSHSLREEGPTRLCYAGTVLRARPPGAFGSRAPIKIGAELYGVAGPEGDVEVLTLMVETLAAAGLDAVHVELGHVAIYRRLVEAAGLTPEIERALFAAVQGKATADVEALLNEAGCDAEVARMLCELPTLLGDADVLDRARDCLANAPAEVAAALDELQQVAARVRSRIANVRIGFDLAELHGYHYHTSIVFAAYSQDHGRAVARGGRYDNIGATFGRARPATGFDADLKLLAELGDAASPGSRKVIAPDDAELDEARRSALWRTVADLRSQGVRVIASPAQAEGAGHLAWVDDDWQVIAD